MEGERDHRFWIRRPDDFHLHVRDGAMMNFVVPFTAKVFGRCTIMPNTVPPITRVEQVRSPSNKTITTVRSRPKLTEKAF